MSDKSYAGPSGLTAEEQELLSYLLAEEQLPPAPAPLRPRREQRATAPLSYAQQRLWFLDQLWPGAHVYNNSLAVRFQGRLDTAALELALNQLVRRHETLRTTFKLTDEGPVQVVAPTQPVRLAHVDLSRHGDGEREEAVRRWIAEEIKRPFDLTRGPLLRVSLLRLGAAEHVGVLVLHHIISDGWSQGVLFEELGLCYGAALNGTAAPLADLPIQYADYAVWQRERLQGEVLADQLDYWREQLAGVPELLELPTDRPHPPVQSFRGARADLLLPPLAGLKALRQQEGVTTFMVLLAAFQILLARYTGQTDIVVGTPVAGREQVQTEGLIGFFVNTLALRTDLAGDPSVRELLRRVREVALGAYARPEVPFEKLIEELRGERSQSHQPLVQVAFALDNMPTDSLQLTGVTLRKMNVVPETARFDLMLSVRETPKALAATLEYSTDLFDAATIKRMLGHYATLLAAVAADPDQPVSRLPMLTADEERSLVAAQQQTTQFAPGDCLHQLFEAQARRTPDAVALVCEDKRLTYGELNRRANQLARRLRALGVGPEVLVGVCLERSLHTVVGILGVLKAGGAYVPLDPAYPQERLAFMLADARIELVITEQPLVERLPPDGLRLLCLDQDWQLCAREPADDFASVARPDNTAYVIYTSGSTGRPKGVLVTHANVARLFAATAAWFNFGAHDTWTLFHSYAFDFSVWELWGALLYGGRLVVVPYLVSREPAAFHELLARERVTVLNQTPSAFRQLLRVDEAAGAGALSLRLVIFGGEALDLQSLQPWYNRHDDAAPTLVNMYGITETTVHVTYRPLRLADVQARAGSVIGAPIPDLEVYVLDPHMQLVPAGLPGELYVGGAGLARGYLNRPELTAERFVPHPFSAEPGARLYRTGDLARRRADGELEYLGRCDEQVKIRGFRIELGEVEAVLGRHEAVKEVVVVARTDAAGERQLVAYFVPSAAAPTDGLPNELRRYLREHVPDYMIPSAFVPMAQWPLTPSGKINRRALPAPEPARPELQELYVAPRNDAETALAAIWADVLNVERVGVHDNFFDLGGDSIRSVRIMAMARERGLHFTLQQLFQYQTIHELVSQLAPGDAPDESAGRTEPFSLISAAERQRLPADVEDAYPLAMLQAGMLFHMAYRPEQMVYHNVYSYHLKARLDLAALGASLRWLIERHAILRTSFDLTTYQEPLQLVHRTAPLPLHVADISHLTFAEQEAALAAFVEREKSLRFDFGSPPLIRFAVHRRDAETFNFTFTECHPILDGWSLHSLLAELFTYYFSLLHNRPVAHYRPLTSSYRDFVALERAALASDEARQFWHDKLDGCTVMELPRQLAPSAPADGGQRIRKLSEQLSAELSEGLPRLARELGLPLKSVLLAAHLKVMSLISGETDVLTGVLSVGRPETADAEHVLGLFFNTLPFRFTVARGSWAELIKAAFAAELELLPFRRYPVAALQQQRGRKAIFENVFTYLHFHVLDDLFQSGDLELLGAGRYWEETNLTLSTAFKIHPHSERLHLSIRYDSTQFSAPQMGALRDYYLSVLTAMLRDPAAPHTRESLLSAAELRRCLVEWNDTETDADPTVCAHELFAVQAARTPDAVAVVYEDEQLTYGELNRRANQLARHLQTAGISPEVTVGILMERSLEIVIAILGVLKAGGAYVPLDHQSPPERLAVMAEEADIQLLLTQQRMSERLPRPPAPVLRMDADWPLVAQSADSEPPRRAARENLAYMFFTSGSTGRPKAVAVEHRQLLNYLTGIEARLTPPAPASFAMLSTFATDLGLTMFYPALCSGGTLHIISQERAADPAALAAYFKRHPVDCLKLVPTHLAALLSAAPAADILPRRQLILGGEAASWSLVETVRKLAPDCAILNHYGPTETTVGVLTYAVPHASLDHRPAAPPLGRHLANTQVYILDADLNPVPPGTPGELHVGGASVSRGYFARPDLTAEKFIPDPFSRRAGARLYKTGDRARHLPGGDVEFLGRIDQQVKIRGYRVELKEIEQTLLRHPAVREAAVVAHEDADGDKRLLAYVVPVAETSIAGHDLRNHARSTLPDYMLPAAFVTLAALPLSPNGKLDRRALPAADSYAAEPAAHVTPQSEAERMIAAVWREALHIEQVSVRDNFFDLGGHSLIMLQIQSKLRAQFGRNVSIVEMFEHPTIQSLARHLSAAESTAQPDRHLHAEADARRATLGRRRQLNQD